MVSSPSRPRHPRPAAAPRIASRAWTAAILPGVLLLLPAAGPAQWLTDGMPVAGPGGSYQYDARVVSDGAGGVIAAWTDSRNSSASPDVYAQRFDARGRELWTPGGVPVCTAIDGQYPNGIVPDGAGGAVVNWNDYRNGGIGDIYAQRIDGSGAMLWATDGVAVCVAPTFQGFPRAIPDGTGGMIAAWTDGRNGVDSDVYASRIDGAGTPLWSTGGVPVCTAIGYQDYAVLASDDAGGAIIGWSDPRSGTFDVYAQRMGAVGTAAWAPNGVIVCAAAGGQVGTQIVRDGAGGAILAWLDNRGSSQDVYAQRVDASGAARWFANGVAVCTQSTTEYDVALLEDGSGGAFMAWTDYRAPLSDIYAQRLTALGTALWQYQGRPIATGSGYQAYPRLAPAGTDGMTVIWQDQPGTTLDIRAQRVDSAGDAQWGYYGVAVTSAAENQWISSVATDGAGNLCVAWDDYRSSAGRAYFQRIEGRFGAWGCPEPTVASVADVPHDEGGRVAVNWLASGRDMAVPRTIGHYSIWRAVDALPAAGGGRVLGSAAELASIGLRDTGPVYLSSPPGYYWELAGTQAAQGWPGYSFATPTRADSVAGDPGDEQFMVVAHDQYDDYVAYASNAASGHSVDNLAPAPPLLLAAQRSGPDVVLRWSRVPAGDLRDYAVYRAQTAGVIPGEATFLGSAADTVLVDAAAPSTALYYVVTAIDVHANRSLPSPEANVGASTGIDELAAATGLVVLGNRPNPFVSTTEFELGLPARTDVSIRIFDVAGRLVRSLERPGMGPGFVRIPFDGRDDAGRPLASGVGFYKVTANGHTATRRMVVAR